MTAFAILTKLGNYEKAFAANKDSELIAISNYVLPKSYDQFLSENYVLRHGFFINSKHAIPPVGQLVRIHEGKHKLAFDRCELRFEIDNDIDAAIGLRISCDAKLVVDKKIPIISGQKKYEVFIDLPKIAIGRTVDIRTSNLSNTSLSLNGMSGLLSCNLSEIVQTLTERYHPETVMTDDVQSNFAGRIVDISKYSYVNDEDRLRTIAFYLPQYHSIPENDLWWGKGFTEWTNVKKATPQMPDHDQPRIPHPDIGHYELLNTGVLENQAQIARKYGISGFCYHYYWFDGIRLLEKPLELMLTSGSPDMPFCLCWANENWTRRWDGEDNEILIAQQHSDDIGVIRDLQRYFRDPRYIRIDGRPVFLIYRADKFPNMNETISRWREDCRAVGEAEPYLIMVQSFHNYAPNSFDAAVQFPPHLPPESGGFKRNLGKHVNGNFVGTVIDYDHLMDQTLSYYRPTLPAYPCVSPAWDNTPRRGSRATIFHGSTPEKYAKWLNIACQQVENHFPPNQQLVFINAWNEWAEGAYLEPDKTTGYKYLETTNKIVSKREDPKALISDNKHVLKILVIGHDAALAGSQVHLLNTIRWLKQYAAVEISLILLRGGFLVPEYQKYCRVLLCKNPNVETVTEFCGVPDLIYGNTVVSAECYDKIAPLGLPIITAVHEMENSIKKFATPETVQKMLAHTSSYIAASDPVSLNLQQNHEVPGDIITTITAFINPDGRPLPADKKTLRPGLDLPQSQYLIVGCGSRDWRKGVDLFVEVARHIIEQHPDIDINFCWVGGGFDPKIRNPLMLAQQYGIANRILFVGEKKNSTDYFRAADIFLLPSREDPYPLVALEAAEAKTPVVCFEGSGGMPAFIGNDVGIVVPMEDTKSMADAAVRLLKDNQLRENLGTQAKSKILSTSTVDVAGPKILDLMRRTAGKPHPISVIVPNFNYAKYLDIRLESVVRQNFRDMEIVVLDDASTDGSLEILKKWQHYGGLRVIVNESNSGNTFSQWRKGLEETRGSYIWIAEADDLCKDDFLTTMIRNLTDKNTVLSFSIPGVIDESGRKIDLDYRTNYLAFASPDRWNRSHIISQPQKIAENLGIVNCIPNVSAAVFRRPKNTMAIDAAMQYSCSGDWMFYLMMARAGSIAYTHGDFASHRRHSKSVISNTNILLAEMISIHEYVRNHFPMTDEILDKIGKFENSVKK